RAGHQYVPPGPVPVLERREGVAGVAVGGGVVIAQTPDVVLIQGDYVRELVCSQGRVRVGNIEAGDHAPGRAVPMEYEGRVSGRAIAGIARGPDVIAGCEGYGREHVDRLPGVGAAYLRPLVAVPV